MKMENAAEEKIDIRSMTLDELTDFTVNTLGWQKYRAGQLYRWMHVRLAGSFDEMTDLSKSMRAQLAQTCRLVSHKMVRRYVSKIDGTAKYLFGLDDGNVIESVLMRYRYGLSVCISSQVGCRMGCRFCASTIGGLVRNLTASEMLDEIYQIQKDVGQRVSNVVVMGTGEPFDNFDNVIRMIRILSGPDGLNISQRSITVSTCGIVPGIRDFADLGLQVTLAISLHASNDADRQRLMPVARRYSLTELLDACHYYQEKTGKRLSFEYSLVSGANDSEASARELAGLLKGFDCHVNLIPVNPVEETGMRQPQAQTVSRFKSVLEKNGINVTIRREMGRDISAACGQLRKKYMSSQLSVGED